MNLYVQITLIYLIIFLILGIKTRFKYSVYTTLLLVFLYIFLSFTYSLKELYDPNKISKKYNSRPAESVKTYGYGKPRIVVSLSTLPSRIDGVVPTLKSILDNTMPPDAIYLNIPDYSKRESRPYEIPDSILELSPIVKINKTQEDYGPVTKLYPTLEVETDPETLIICIDDDIAYDPKLIENLVYASDRYTDDTICISGWNYIKVLNLFTLPLYFPFFFSRNVKVLQCYMGVLYKRKFFNNVELFKKYMSLKPCFTTDDIMISKFLDKTGVKITMIPVKLNNKKLESQNGSMLSDFNTNNNQWIKCINCEPDN